MADIPTFRDLIRTTNILRDIGKNPIVTTEFSVDQDGILCGVDESLQLLQHITQNPNVEIWAMNEGEQIYKGDVIITTTRMSICENWFNY